MLTTTTQKEFVVPLENKPGTLAEVAAALGKANVNITGYLVESQGDYGVFRFVTNEPAKTESWLKESRRPYRTHEVIAVTAPNNPGELGRIATMLAKSGINVRASYPAAMANGIGTTLCVDDITSARKVLQG